MEGRVGSEPALRSSEKAAGGPDVWRLQAGWLLEADMCWGTSGKSAGPFGCPDSVSGDVAKAT